MVMMDETTSFSAQIHLSEVGTMFQQFLLHGRCVFCGQSDQHNCFRRQTFRGNSPTAVFCTVIVRMRISFADFDPEIRISTITPFFLQSLVHIGTETVLEHKVKLHDITVFLISS